jgi:hypothetical protein
MMMRIWATQFRTTTIGLLSLTTVLTIAPTLAQTKSSNQPTAKVVSGDIFVAGTRDRLETRTLVLKANSQLRNFRLSSTDLPQKDGSNVFPARQIQPEIASRPDVPAGETLSIPIQFDLRKANSSGDFRGNLVIQHEEGELFVPVMVQVKDGWLLPLLLLLSGVGGAILLANYLTDSVDRTDMLVEVGRLRTQMQADAQVPAEFKAKIAAYLADVEAALEWQHRDKADDAIALAKATWERWRSARLDWLQLFHYKAEELDTPLGPEIPTDTPYGRGLQHNLSRLQQEITHYDSCLKWAEQLDEVRKQLERYLQVQNQISQLVGLRDRLDYPASPGIISAIDFDNTLNNLLPEDQAGLSTLENSLSTTLDELKQQLISTGQPLSPEFSLGSARTLLSPVKLIPPPPKVPKVGVNLDTIDLETNQWKRQSYQWAGRAIGLGLLCGIGFHQLYWAKPTFGANWVGEGISLVSWGFGAELSRKSLSKLLQQARLPRSLGRE